MFGNDMIAVTNGNQRLNERTKGKGNTVSMEEERNISNINFCFWF